MGVKQSIALLATAAAVLAAPAAASAQASLTVDPVDRCYREQSTVALVGEGFTPNAPVGFSRNGITLGDPIPADASGQINANLTLPDLVSGQQRLTYLATDGSNPAVTAQIGLLVSATDVRVKPRHGAPNRRLTITGRGFTRAGGRSLWAHIVRAGRPARTARSLRVGRLHGACKTIKTRKRLFPAGAAAGGYHVQFDTFRRYESTRVVKVEFDVKVFRTARSAYAATTSG